MTKRYSILSSKLQELASILDDLLLQHHGTETESHDTLSRDIKQKFVFIRNLLNAEVASHPSKPHHLNHMSHRFDELERAFHVWDSNRTLSNEELDKDETCSCTESCLNDDGEALDDNGLVVFEDSDNIFADDYVGDNKALVEFNGGVVEPEAEAEEQNRVVGFEKVGSFGYEDAEDYFIEDNKKELVEFDGRKGKKGVRVEREEIVMGSEGRRGSECGKKCCAWACGFVYGMVFMGFIMMVTFSGCFDHSVEDASFVVPT